jgi:hypothetical protein
MILDPKGSPELCRVSKKFIYAAKTQYKDFGSWILWRWQSRRHSHVKWFVRIEGVAFFLAAILFAFDQWKPESHEYILLPSIIFITALSVYWIWIFICRGIISQPVSWRKLINIDTWAGVTAMLGLHSIFFANDPTQLEIPQSLFKLGILVFAIYFYILIRGLETAFLKCTLKNSFLDRAHYWLDRNTIEKSLNGLDFCLFAMGAILVGSFFWIKGFPPFYRTSLSLVFLIVPYSQWLMTWTLKCADTHRFSASQYSYFRNLRKFKLFIFHQFGVLTQGKMKIQEQVIDADDEWSKDEIKDILFRMTENSNHPVAALIHEKFRSNKRSLVTIDRVDFKSHLGIQVEFKDLQGRATLGVLGGMTWHKVLQHEIFPETLVKLKDWKEKKYKVVLLSLNRKILAMFALEDPLRENLSSEIEALKASGVYPVMMSSNEDFFECAEGQDPLLERAVNLVPVERHEQKRYWLEREPRALEVVGYWDQVEEPIVIFTPERSLVPIDRSAFVAPRMNDLKAVILLSRKHHCLRHSIVALSFLLTLILVTLIS